MPSKLPLIPTLLVGAAVAAMIALGLWQLRRAEWKADLLTRYRAAEAMSAEVPWPRTPDEVERALYRYSSLTCDRVLETRATAGRSMLGQTGWAHVARCALDDGGEAEVAFGWSREPATPPWSGGPVAGFVSPAGDGARLVTASPMAGLEPLARPDPNDLPNNHMAYAVQWFFFAGTAILVYLLALRRRGKGVRD